MLTSAVVLELDVPDDFALYGKPLLISALEALFNKEPAAPGNAQEAGPGGAVLQSLYMRTEDADVMSGAFERLRREYPLASHEQGVAGPVTPATTEEGVHTPAASAAEVNIIRSEN